MIDGIVIKLGVALSAAPIFEDKMTKYQGNGYANFQVYSYIILRWESFNKVGDVGDVVHFVHVGDAGQVDQIDQAEGHMISIVNLCIMSFMRASCIIHRLARNPCRARANPLALTGMFTAQISGT